MSRKGRLGRRSTTPAPGPGQRTERKGGRFEERRRDDSGSETAEIVLVLPALMLLLAFAFQLAMWALAAHAIALGVAEGGAESRAALGSPSDATAVVRRSIDHLAGALILNPVVRARRLYGDYVDVSASGEVPSVVPGLRLRVFSRSLGPVQVFRPSG